MQRKYLFSRIHAVLPLLDDHEGHQPIYDRQKKTKQQITKTALNVHFFLVSKHSTGNLPVRTIPPPSSSRTNKHALCALVISSGSSAKKCTFVTRNTTGSIGRGGNGGEKKWLERRWTSG
ncbi:hypothetical protein GWI33_003538 [Rhynchophorus ferrugineus]|uniref:Uncharacterized protein n=1 Tax=Rhynchophorus ferrugineus TaxID=354439 RepID=A0A834LX18_RHYFE|nr:hypothetical protein GWI33_003538 [Rhynchophorus ferrugineus]